MAPFEFSEAIALGAFERALFMRSFGSPPPDYPQHFVARHRATGVPAGYVHYTRHSDGVYLCGGLCVDKGIYRKLTADERRVAKGHGSLSRWLLNESIALLTGKAAVFAYTGNLLSVRDGLASGFVSTRHPRLIVQWHAAPREEQPRLVAAIAAIGPF
jgi:hypothetical protein